ncbi:MAG: Nif3-like dinuclear metal center hexameric protein, partial [Acidimicrobiia bacterium]
GSIRSMTSLGDLYGSLNELMPFSMAAGWDPVGIQLGDPAADLRRVGVCHEVTSLIVEQAVASGLDALVSYHPLLFTPTTSLVAGPGAAGRAWSLVSSGVALLVTHTAFDVAPGGSADSLAAALNIKAATGFAPIWGGESVRITVFVPEPATNDVAAAMANAGAGVIGNYANCTFRAVGVGTFRPERGASPTIGAVGEPTRVEETRLEMIAARHRVDAVVAALVAAHPYEEPSFDVVDRRGDAGFLGRIGSFGGSIEELRALVDEQLGGASRVSGPGPVEPLRVAVVPGSGAGQLAAAATGGGNVMVTGDVKHHDARRAAELGIAVIDPGHAATEKPGVARLYAAVAGVVTDAVDLTAVDADPWTPTWE